MVWGCFAGDTVCDLFRIEDTLNHPSWLPQHSAVIHHAIWFALSGTTICFFNRTMPHYTSRLCKGYLTKKESDGVLHQMTPASTITRSQPSKF